MARPNIFISYSHRDERILRSLLPYLESLQRQNLAEIWSDTDLKGGDRWREEIEAALNSATVAVLLISQHFLNSSFIYEEELPRIFRRQSEAKLTVLPVYLSPSTVTSASISFIDNNGNKRDVLLSDFQGFGTPDRTIKELAPTERDRRFLKLHDRIKDLAALAPPTALASAVGPVSAVRAQPNCFNWLHLTDLHYGLSGQSPLWPNVRQVFFDDLAHLHRLCGPWHAVLFTGDLAQAGQNEEFEKLEERVFQPLWELLRKLGSKDAVLLAVPGNHDLVRPKKLTAALRQLNRKDGFHEIAEEFWNEPACEYRQLIDAAFSNYISWWERTKFRGTVKVQNGILPGDFSATLDISSSVAKSPSLQIGIVGLNTTFLQLAGGDYMGRLAWDVKQMHAVCSDDVPAWIKRHDFSILLTHQGPEWLDQRSLDEGHPEINPAGRFAVHLFGHMHENFVRSTSTGAGKPLRHWQGCSLFGMERFGEPPKTVRRHGYAAGRLEFAEKAATIRHWPRCVVKDANGWLLIRDDASFILDEADEGTHAEVVHYL